MQPQIKSLIDAANEVIHGAKARANKLRGEAATAEAEAQQEAAVLTRISELESYLKQKFQEVRGVREHLATYVPKQLEEAKTNMMVALLHGGTDWKPFYQRVLLLESAIKNQEQIVRDAEAMEIPRVQRELYELKAKKPGLLKRLGLTE